VLAQRAVADSPRWTRALGRTAWPTCGLQTRFRAASHTPCRANPRKTDESDEPSSWWIGMASPIPVAAW